MERRDRRCRPPRLVGWLGLGASKFFAWKQRYGKVNEHNTWVPRDHWLEPWEKQAIVDFARAHPLEGYRRLAFMMLDADVVAVSPASVYRVLARPACCSRGTRRPARRARASCSRWRPHEHWHIDVSYLNICGTFYYLCSVLDGCSRSILHWEIRESMTEPEVELVLQQAKEKYPGTTPRLITDNGPQFIARDFKEFIRLSGMDHVRTSPYYPQTNGKIERWHGSLKAEAIRPETPLTLEDARRSSATSWSITTPGGCTARSATSRRTIAWPAGTPRSGRSGIANSRPPASVAPRGGTRRVGGTSPDADEPIRA